MGSQQVPLYLLGVLITFCLEGSKCENPGLSKTLRIKSSPCQGQVEVCINSTWYMVDSKSWGLGSNHQDNLKQASNLCKKLNCGEAVDLAYSTHFSRPRNQLTCWGQVGSLSNCSISKDISRKSLSLICEEPPKKAPPPTSPPTVTTPEPTAPPRLQLVAGPWGLHCAGVLEFYAGGLVGSVLFETLDRTHSLKNRICEALQCGSFVKYLPEDETARALELGLSQPLPIRWRLQNASCAFPDQCFVPIKLQDSGLPLALLCSGFQPKVQSRLVEGSSPCAGFVEVQQNGQWEALCSSSKSPARWEEVCQEQKCGQFRSYRILEASEDSSGYLCSQEKLSQCHLLKKRDYCKKVFVTCQDPNPEGLGAGTILSIILGLVLAAVLLIMFGPMAYRKLMKKLRQKKQRQWIGPREMSQSMSFHRNHMATVRSPTDSAVSTEGNEYSQPPSSACSAYPALEGALHRASVQPDNSSDSDYDLHMTQRL